MTFRPDDVIETPEEVAAVWFGRKRIGGLDEAAAAEFEAWRGADPRHAEEYEALERAWYGVETMRNDPRVLAMREAALRRNRLMRRLYAPMAVAACLLALVGGGWLAVTGDLLPGRQFKTQAFRTGIGESARITLPDGSVLTLNTDTVVRTEKVKGRRQVYLDRGEAFFQVAKDRSRPFIVNAAGRTVTAVGTAFEVRVDPGRFEVTLVEGKVRVEAPLPNAAPTPAAAPTRMQATEMVAGTQLLASDDRAWKLQEVNAARETSWTTGQLVFFTKPLSEVAAELNRYSDTKIIVADPKIAAVPITGTFKPGDNKGFAAAVASYGMARAAPQPDGTIRLIAPELDAS